MGPMGRVRRAAAQRGAAADDIRIPVRGPDGDTDASKRVARMLHEAIVHPDAAASRRITAAACSLPQHALTTLETGDALALTKYCAERTATGWGAVCLLVSVILAGWAFVSSREAARQRLDGQPVTVWELPPWVILLPLLVAGYMQWYLPSAATTTMTAQQLEMALTTMTPQQYMTYRSARENLSSSTALASSGVLAAAHVATSVIPN